MKCRAKFASLRLVTGSHCSHSCRLPRVTCGPVMGKYPLQCARLLWDDSRRSWMRMTVWAEGLHCFGLSRKETCSSQEHPHTVFSCRYAAARTAVGLPDSDVGGRLRRPQSVHLRAHQSASVPGDALQHDLLSQHDGPLWPGHRSRQYGGESPEHHMYQLVDICCSNMAQH